MIQIENVSRVYRRGADEVHALEHVTLTIQRGRFVALMGPSGSGKSTLLNLLAGLDRPSEGSVTVAGRRLNELSEDELASFRSQHVGFVFQFFNLIPVLSARGNVELPLLLTTLGKAERRERAETALRVVGLGERADHMPSELSGGEQQRVAIARAIVTDPEIVVADEPTGDLDAKNAVEILALLRDLRREFGKTVVMVTHDPRGEQFVDEIHHLDKGLLDRTVPGGAARVSMVLPFLWRNLTRNKLRSLLTGGAIALAIALVCLLATMPDGMNRMLEQRRLQHARRRAQRGRPRLPAALRLPAEGARDAGRGRGDELDLVRRRLRGGEGRRVPELRGRARRSRRGLAGLGDRAGGARGVPRATATARSSARGTLDEVRLEDRRPRHAEGHASSRSTSRFRIVGEIPNERAPHFWFQREYLEQALEAAGGDLRLARHDLGARRRPARASIR